MTLAGKFNVRLREVRRSKQLSQLDLANLSGTTVAAVGLYEMGKRLPGFFALLNLCDALDVSADWLMGRTP